jgi:hypothetical protein
METRAPAPLHHEGDFDLPRQVSSELPTPNDTSLRTRLRSWLDRPHIRVTLVVALLALAGVLFALAVRPITGWSSVTPLIRMLTGASADASDSWMPMFNALSWHRVYGDGIYAHVFFEQGVKFQYPPSSLLPLMLIETVTPLTYDLLNAINRAVFLGTCLAVGVLAYLVIERIDHLGQIGRGDRLVLAGFCAGACLVFYPLTMAISLGQIQAWINFVFVLACICWLQDRKATTGVLIGLLCLIKPQLALIGIWALIRKEWRLAAGMLACGMVGLAISVAIFGIDEHIEYMKALSFIAARGEAYYPNQSLNGLLQRLIGHAPVFETNAFPPYDPVVHIGSLIGSVLIIALALFAPRARGQAQHLLEFQFAALAFSIASPVAWEHHYGIVAPMLVVLFAMAALQQLTGRQLALLATAYVLTSNYIGITDLLTGQAAPLSLLQSYMFFGGLILLYLTWSIIRSERTVATAGAPQPAGGQNS